MIKKTIFILIGTMLTSACSYLIEKEKAEREWAIQKEVRTEKKRNKAFEDLKNSSDSLRKE